MVSRIKAKHTQMCDLRYNQARKLGSLVAAMGVFLGKFSNISKLHGAETVLSKKLEINSDTDECCKISKIP